MMNSFLTDSVPQAASLDLNTTWPAVRVVAANVTEDEFNIVLEDYKKVKQDEKKPSMT